MTKNESSLPSLDMSAMVPTRDALHAYARVLGAWLKASRARRKHWWHASLRPSLAGLTTGPMHSVGAEIELDLAQSRLRGRSVRGNELDLALTGQPAGQIADELEAFMRGLGAAAEQVPTPERDSKDHEGYRADTARELGRALRFVAVTLEEFRAGIREETSPIQIWPHHFDLSMLWLPGEKIAGEDPSDEESSDKQMNFGFVFGDESIEEPYFYITAYPSPAAFADLPLAPGASWTGDGFSGVVLPYRRLRATSDPGAYLLSLWQGLLTAGRELLLR